VEKARLIALGAVAFVIYMGRNQLKSVLINGQDALANRNVQAFLAMIRKYESAGRYDVIYGGQTFGSYAQHPNIRVPFVDPRTGKNNYSTAAGAYQITNPTWQTILRNAGTGDFSPASQDAAAVWLLKLNGALSAIMAGDFQTAIETASKTWASLPYTDSQQRHVTLAQALTTYQQAGGATA
jgi:lysozyme